MTAALQVPLAILVVVAGRGHRSSLCNASQVRSMAQPGVLPALKLRPSPMVMWLVVLLLGSVPKMVVPPVVLTCMTGRVAVADDHLIPTRLGIQPKGGPRRPDLQPRLALQHSIRLDSVDGLSLDAR